MSIAPVTAGRRENGWRGRQANLQALALLTGKIDAADVLDSARSAILEFEPWTPPASDAGALVRALAAIRPDGITPEVGAALGEVIARADLARTWQPEVDEAFGLLSLLAPTPARASVLRIVIDVLRATALHRRWFDRATRLLARISDLDPNSVDVSTLIDVLQVRDAEERDALVRLVIGPLILANPGDADVTTLRRVVELQSEPQRTRYLFAAIAGHATASKEVRQYARGISADWFPLREPWRHVLATSSPRILCVQNIADGQGDEIVRVVPLLQAFLDEFPASRVTLITDRGYLYRHANIETISFDEPDRVRQAMNQDSDILIEFADHRRRHLNLDPDLIEAVARYRLGHQPRLDVTAEKGWNRFTFGRVVIGNMEWAGPLGANRSVEPNVYDPVFRLIAELGLPLRVGEQPPAGESVLSGRRSPDSETAWNRAIGVNSEQRPVALLNPFGGNARLKGFTPRTFGDLVVLVERLVAEGYLVRVCANGQPWGSTDSVNAVLSRLPAATRRYVDLVPVPSSVGTGAAEPENDGNALAAQEFMRRLITFVERADLIVTVEGWMMHAAFLEGRPYRLLTLPASEAGSWHPWGRGAHQRQWIFSGEPEFNEPPLPEQPRKQAWLELIRHIDTETFVPYLAQIAATEDLDIREAATRAIGRTGGTQYRSWLTERLTDGSHKVRGAAASALLDRHRDAIGTGSVPGADTLVAHRLIADSPPSWSEVVAMGERALPALDVALHGDDPVIRREAALCIERIGLDLVEAVAGAHHLNHQRAVQVTLPRRPGALGS